MTFRRLYFAFSCLFCLIGNFATAQRGPATVLVAQAIEAETSEGRSFVGTVWPTRISEVGSAASGRIKTLHVRQGQRVKKGEPLAQLRTKIIQAQVDAAKATLDLRKSELAEMKAGNRKEEIDQTQARVESAKTLQNLREVQLKRARTLVGRGVSREELEEAVSQAQQADAALREAEASLQLMKAGFRQEKIDQAAARVREQEAIHARLEEELSRYTIVAPFDGYVLAGHAEEGQWATQGMLIARVAEMDSVDIQAEVLEDYISKIRIGDSASVTLDALSDKVFTGKVKFILPLGDSQARTFPVKVRVENEMNHARPLLKAGMFARVTFSVGRPIKAVMVPKDALVLGGRTPTVYVVEDLASMGKGKGKAVPVNVELGVSQGNAIQVKGSIEPGQWVVIQGNERLRPNQEVLASPAN